MSNLHGKMVNIQPMRAWVGETYLEGHRDARHTAAEIALSADAEIERLRVANEQMRADCADAGNALASVEVENERLRAALTEIANEQMRADCADAGNALASVEVENVENERLRAALTEIRDRIKGHPAYAELTEAEEDMLGGDTAEFSYLARVADAALGQLLKEE
jgi:hypothetical protein